MEIFFLGVEIINRSVESRLQQICILGSVFLSEEFHIQFVDFLRVTLFLFQFYSRPFYHSTSIFIRNFIHGSFQSLFKIHYSIFFSERKLQHIARRCWIHMWFSTQMQRGWWFSAFWQFLDIFKLFLIIEAWRLFNSWDHETDIMELILCLSFSNKKTAEISVWTCFVNIDEWYQHSSLAFHSVFLAVYCGVSFECSWIIQVDW